MHLRLLSLILLHTLGCCIVVSLNLLLTSDDGQFPGGSLENIRCLGTVLSALFPDPKCPGYDAPSSMPHSLDELSVLVCSAFPLSSCHDIKGE